MEKITSKNTKRASHYTNSKKTTVFAQKKQLCLYCRIILLAQRPVVCRREGGERGDSPGHLIQEGIQRLKLKNLKCC